MIKNDRETVVVDALKMLNTVLGFEADLFSVFVKSVHFQCCKLAHPLFLRFFSDENDFVLNLNFIFNFICVRKKETFFSLFKLLNDL